MRKIKFRCWCAHTQTMHSWREMVKLNKIHLLSTQQASYPVMQFTGLKDINGSEIYDCDILHCLDPVSFDPMVVEYSQEQCCFIVKISQWTTLQVNEKFIRDNELVLIGNIHQNPELLNEK